MFYTPKDLFLLCCTIIIQLGLLPFSSFLYYWLSVWKNFPSACRIPFSIFFRVDLVLTKSKTFSLSMFLFHLHFARYRIIDWQYAHTYICIFFGEEIILEYLSLLLLRRQLLFITSLLIICYFLRLFLRFSFCLSDLISNDLSFLPPPFLFTAVYAVTWCLSSVLGSSQLSSLRILLLPISPAWSFWDFSYSVLGLSSSTVFHLPSRFYFFF